MNEQVKSKAIILGCYNPEILKEVSEVLDKGFPHMMVCALSKGIFNNAWDLILKDVSQMKEDIKISQFIKKPENVQEVLKTCALIRANVGEVAFGLKELVEKSEMTYEQAKSVINLLYAFGFLAKREEDGREIYLLIDTHDLKIEYMTSLEVEAKEHLHQIQAIKKNLAKESKPTPAIKKAKVKKE